MTSLTGGTFNPGLNLTFEKQLLIMVMYFFEVFLSKKSCSRPGGVGLPFHIFQFLNTIVQLSVQPFILKYCIAESVFWC